MAKFRVPEVKDGAILNYKIVNSIVVINEPKDIAVLRKEPKRFIELSETPIVSAPKPAPAALAVPAPTPAPTPAPVVPGVNPTMQPKILKRVLKK